MRPIHPEYLNTRIPEYPVSRLLFLHRPDSTKTGPKLGSISDDHDCRFVGPHVLASGRLHVRRRNSLDSTSVTADVVGREGVHLLHQELIGQAGLRDQALSGAAAHIVLDF